MSKAFSSTKPSSLPPPKAIATSSAKNRLSPRSPLQDLNRISNSSNSSYASSNLSTEPPSGCLRFLSSSSFKTPASHKQPKSLSKTPNSVPDGIGSKQPKSKSSKENLSRGSNAEPQAKRISSNKVRSCQKNPPCRTGQKSKPCSVLSEHGKLLPGLAPGSEELKGKKDSLRGIIDNGNEDSRLKTSHGTPSLTPLSRKVAELDLDSTIHEDVNENSNRSASRTPPINNSVSPEIQCGSSLVSTTTPACYGAGYLVSGVTDKRKCRPRGILTVEENYSGFDKTAADSFDDGGEKKVTDVSDNVSPSLLPLPAEALVHWLSSPRNKGKKVLSPNADSAAKQSEGLAESTTFDSSTSPSCSSKSFWNITDGSDLSGTSYHIRRKMSSSISPSGISEFQVRFDSMLSPSYPSILFSTNSMLSCSSSGKGKKDQYNPIDENSPLSLTSIGSGNVMQTPESDYGSDLHVALSFVHTDNRKQGSPNPVLNSINDVFTSESLHLNSSVPPEDSVNSSFQFDCLAVPCESIDFSKLPRFSDDQDPWLSSCTIGNASESQSQMSQPYDPDEFDCCRCLSDEEDLANHRDSDRLSAPRIDEDDGCEISKDVNIAHMEDNELEIVGLAKYFQL
ncbi:cell wall protein RBR3 isoform X2 [Arachis ipaensis]|uniref:cell wall protein RBR3 isoform X2 n=1 Tax=Arachis ipaensis TaxID=130454 RepID=UPI0007AF9836|nr:cell wall protein RBR3 isoform X2 [Arachis ipaensis]